MMNDKMNSYQKSLLASIYQDFNRMDEVELLKIKSHYWVEEELTQLWDVFKRAKKMGLSGVPQEFLSKEWIAELSKQKDNASYEFFYKQMVGHIQYVRNKEVMEEFQEKIDFTDDLEEKSKLYEEMADKMMEISSFYIEDEAKTLMELVPDMYAEETIVPPLSTGMDFFDEKNILFYRETPTILQAESGNFKSTQMKNYAIRMALDPQYGGRGYKVLIVSLELTAQYLAQQILAMLANSNVFNWRPFNIKKEELEDKKLAALKLAKIMPNLKIDDSVYTPEKLAKRIRRSKGVYDCIFVDYWTALQIDEESEANGFNKAAKLVTAAIKQTKSVAVVILSQVTAENGKSLKTAEDHMNSKIRAGKQLFNDAGLEIISFRGDVPENSKQDENSDLGYENSKYILNLYVRKNRNGEPNMRFQPALLPDRGIIGSFKAPNINSLPDPTLPDKLGITIPFSEFEDDNLEELGINIHDPFDDDEIDFDDMFEE